MKAFRNLGSVPAGATLTADDVLEFHAARLMLLLLVCGGRRRTISGLTKLAKLDFFVRYPSFFSEVVKKVVDDSDPVESAMVRHHYGPWDHRYYHVLAYLEGKRLVNVSHAGRGFSFALTPEGSRTAEQLADMTSFGELTNHIRQVGDALGDLSGNQLKQLIYNSFREQVVDRALGEVIE
jgi:hypothetical protein